MSNYNSSNDSENTDKLSVARAEVEQVTTIVKDNIDKVLQRGEQIEILLQKSESLEESSIMFKNSSKELRLKMCKRNLCYGVVLLCFVIFIILLIIFITQPWK